jgi:cleavage and polyadenylation specificity factor subunit 2
LAGRVAKNVDAVLVSHPTVNHLGALAYAHAQLGLTCPVYGTLPVLSLGQASLEDALMSRKMTEQFDTFTLKDIKASLERAVHLRYSQPTALQGLNCQGITITAFQAGYSLGGTVWKIKKDTDEIVYALNYNHAKERYAVWFR